MSDFKNYNLIIITILSLLFAKNQIQAACFVQQQMNFSGENKGKSLSLQTDTLSLCDTLQTIEKQTKHGKKGIEHNQLPTFNYNNVKNYIFSNLHYPIQALEEEIEGEVLVYFRIEKNGKIDSIKIVKSIHPLLDSAALKLIRDMPQWKPVTRQGVPESISYTVPVLFKLKE